jgi:hypothetical protein
MEKLNSWLSRYIEELQDCGAVDGYDKFYQSRICREYFGTDDVAESDCLSAHQITRSKRLVKKREEPKQKFWKFFSKNLIKISVFLIWKRVIKTLRKT